MKFRLIRREGNFPPNNYAYTDPRTGMKFDGNGGFYFTVDEILKHRRANPRLYPVADIKFLDSDYVSDELDCFTCDRLKNNSLWCKPSHGLVIVKNKEPGNVITLKIPCPNCGHTEATEKLCSTCSGKRVTGHICNQCGFSIPL